MLMAQASSKTTFGLLGICLCCTFIAVGGFFLVMGFFFPGKAPAQLDQAKIKANMVAGATGGKQQDMFDDPYTGEQQKPFISD